MDIKKAKYFDQSSAYIIKVKDYEILKIVGNSGKAIKFQSRKKNSFPDFPIIIQSNKKVWDIGCLYLNMLCEENPTINRTTIYSIANDLLDYLRFLEHFELDILEFPSEEDQRVTYLYRNTLVERVDNGIIANSTASQRINRVVAFYKLCAKKKIFHPDSLKNKPYREIIRQAYIRYEGYIITKDVESTDLAIPNRKNAIQHDALIDERTLHPLDLTEQKIIFKHLKFHHNRVLQLMILFALATGARIQTICTIKIKDIIGLENNSHKYYSLKIGGQTEIDTKNNSNYRLIIPDYVINEINKYINSNEWKNRFKKSCYNDINESPIFLSRFGKSFYTSKSDIRKANAIQKRVDITIGNSIRKNLSDFIKLIRIEHPNFRKFSFHDLRATFGMNLLIRLLESGQTTTQALLHVQQRMGHQNIQTTMRYLNFYNTHSTFKKAQDQYEIFLFKESIL